MYCVLLWYKLYDRLRRWVRQRVARTKKRYYCHNLSSDPLYLRCCIYVYWYMFTAYVHHWCNCSHIGIFLVVSTSKLRPRMWACAFKARASRRILLVYIKHFNWFIIVLILKLVQECIYINVYSSLYLVV